MPMQFAIVCELLEQCYKTALLRKPTTKKVENWFAWYRSCIDAHDTDISALLSTLLPDKRTDRVYCIQAPRLEKIVGRALGLGSSRIAVLARYKDPESGFDLGDCVALILNSTPNHIYTGPDAVTVEAIDQCLQSLASKVRWSSPAVRSFQASFTVQNRDNLENIYRRLSAVEAKWFTRLILKDFRPLILDAQLICRLCDPLLPSALRLREDFTAALGLVQSVKSSLLPNKTCSRAQNQDIVSAMTPEVGIKIGRQQWFKGRSIKHCLDMGCGRMSVEEKIDGEYCQVHIDLRKGTGTRAIQIFSKSGKDSTEDKTRLLGIISESLRLVLGPSPIKQKCILEGEVVVYSDAEKKILPFHKIRNHIARRGRFMGTGADSPPKPYEHLMIIYYDILLLDDQNLLYARHSERFKLLEKIVQVSPGRAELVPRQFIDFDFRSAASLLRKAFSKVIVDRREGLVLKADRPYFGFNPDGSLTSAVCIKLKKEYIGNFGDVGDFAVVGAGYNAAKAKSYTVPNVKWTHFFLGCLTNKEEVKSWQAIPKFTVINVVEINDTQLRMLMMHANTEAVSLDDNETTILTLAPGMEAAVEMTVAFEEPFVFDIRCFSFDKVANTGFWSPRFPVVSKIHLDRDFTDTVTFSELQEMAEGAATAPELDDSQENLAWIARLEQADPGGVAVDAASESTSTDARTPSRRSTTQSTTSTESERRIPVTPSIASSPSLQAPASAVDETRNSHDANASSRLSDSRASLSTQSGSSLHRSPPMEAESKRCFEAAEADAEKLPKRLRLHSSPKVLSRPNHELGTPKPVRLPLGEISLNVSQQSVESSKLPNREKETHSGVVEEEIHGEGTPAVGCHCVYKLNACHLADVNVLVPAHAWTQSEQARKHLKRHGIAHTGRDVLQLVTARGLEMDSERSRQDAILLVDTTAVHKVETRELLENITRVRSELRITPTPSDLITVYDWRFLKHLNILEDEGVIEKYYDGFGSPFERYHVGII